VLPYQAGLGNVRLMTGSFDTLLPVLKKEGIEPGLVYIDGDHRKESLLRYFSFLADISGNGAVIIIDDINYSREMADAWEVIKRHPKVTVTVDIFRMGMAFFRPGAARVSYSVRY
jgi:predicted O-methyltransferase YrrM